MNIAELVQLIHASKHFRDVETSVTLFEDARVVQEGAKIPSRDILHG